MTFDDDHLLLNLPGYTGHLRIYCVKQRIEWPPPEELRLPSKHGTPVYRRLRMSAITDEQRQQLTHVCRGAEYEFVRNDPPETT